MKPATKWTSIVFVSAIALSYLIAQFSQEAHTRSPAPLTLAQIHPIHGTIYSFQGDLHAADPAHIARDTGASREGAIVFSGCAPAAPGDLVPHYNRRTCSILRDVDRSLYLSAFARDIHQPLGIPSEPGRN